MVQGYRLSDDSLWEAGQGQSLRIEGSLRKANDKGCSVFQRRDTPDLLVQLAGQALHHFGQVRLSQVTAPVPRTLEKVTVTPPSCTNDRF